MPRAASTLRTHTSLPTGWQLHRAVVRDVGIQLDLGPSSGVLVRIVVAESSDSGFKAYKRGVRYATSYEHVAKDDDPEGTSQAQPIALRLCEEIVELTEGFETVPAHTEVAETEAPLRTQNEVLEVLASSLPIGGVLVDGWKLRGVTTVGPIEIHCVMEHRDVPMLARLVLHHGSGDTKDRIVKRGWKVTYRTRYGMTAPLRIKAYHEILAEALRDLMGAVK